MDFSNEWLALAQRLEDEGRRLRERRLRAHADLGAAERLVVLEQEIRQLGAECAALEARGAVRRSQHPPGPPSYLEYAEVRGTVAAIERRTWEVYPEILEWRLPSRLRASVVALLRANHWTVEEAVDGAITTLRVVYRLKTMAVTAP